MRQLEEKLAKLRQQNAKRSRAFELQNSQNLDGEEEDQQLAPMQSEHNARKMKNGREDAAKVIWWHDVW